MSLIKKDDGRAPAADARKPGPADAEGATSADDGGPAAGDLADRDAGPPRRAPVVREGRRKRAPDFGFLSRAPRDETAAPATAEKDIVPSAEAPGGTDAAESEGLQVAPIHQSEWRSFAVHIKSEPTLIRPTAPAPEPADPGPERARIERELGVPALVASLARFGTPPVAPPAKKVDRDALERELLAAEGDDVSRLRIGARRLLRSEVRERAAKQADAEDERLATEQEQLQHGLDDQWAELRALRHRAAQEAEAWVQEETRRREAARIEQQAALDKQWQRMLQADPDSVTDTLRMAFPNGTTRTPEGTLDVTDGTTTVLGFLDGIAVVSVACLDRDDLIADTEPPPNGGRRRAVKPRSEARRTDLYVAAVASRVLAAVGRCLSATPAVDEVSCVALRACRSGMWRWEPIYVGNFDRAYAERLLAEGRWGTDTSLLKQAVEEATDVELELADGSSQIAALDLSDDPGLQAVVEHFDAAISSNGSTHGSDSEAVRLFLMGTDAEEGVKEKRGEGDLANLSETKTMQDPGRSARPAASRTAEPDTIGDHGAGEPHAEQPIPEAAAEAAAPGTTGGQGAAEPHAEQPIPEAAVAAVAPVDQVSKIKPDTDPLPQALRDRDASVRRAAVEAIGRRNDPTDTPLLLSALSDPDEIVRLEAMYALRDRLSPDLRREALVNACSDSDETVRRKAIEALADLADERDTPVLLRALRDSDDSVRLEAIYAVKYRLKPEMREDLVNASADANEGVRRKAIEALAELGDDRDTPLLLKALKDPDSSVRLEAIYALEGRSSLGSSARLSEPLLEAMQAEDAAVRQAAVRLFGRL
jgi:hypothetical protein